MKNFIIKWLAFISQTSNKSSIHFKMNYFILKNTVCLISDISPSFGLLDHVRKWTVNLSN